MIFWTLDRIVQEHRFQGTDKLSKQIDKASKNQSIFNPAENLFFTGIVVKATSSDSERIKRFILEETSARLIFQHQDVAYLKIVREVKADE